VVVLEAGEIALRGTIDASGADASVTFGAAPGGGGGGTIIVRSNVFTFEPDSASLSAKGGRGVAGSSSGATVIGGSGGGGLLVLAVDLDSMALANLSIDVAGGTGSSGCVDETAGGNGASTFDTEPDCLDADGDGIAHAACATGPADCNDGDPGIGEGFPELCDGVDQDCDGVPDDGASCPIEGEVCQEGACVAANGGSGVGGTATTAAPRIELAGGLDVCTALPGRQRAYGAPGALLTLLLGALLGRRRRR